MADGKFLERNLQRLNIVSQKTKNKDIALYCAKLAVIELCGWTEQSMDRISLQLARCCIQSPNDISRYETEVIKKIYGFEYDKHFKEMLVQIIGRKEVLAIEAIMDEKHPQQFSDFKSSVGALKAIRNQAAHTSIHSFLNSSNQTNTIHAPSSTINYFKHIRSGLELIEIELSKKFSYKNDCWKIEILDYNNGVAD